MNLTGMYTLPTRKKHEKLFEMLDSNLQGTLKNYDRKSSIIRNYQPIQRDSNIGEKKISEEMEQHDISKLDIASLDLNANLKTMSKDQLKQYIRVMKIKMKLMNDFYSRLVLEDEQEFSKQLKQFESKFQDIDIQKIIKERESFRKDYQQEMKKSKSIKSVLESQKRILTSTGSQFKITNNRSMIGLGGRPLSMGKLK